MCWSRWKWTPPPRESGAVLSQLFGEPPRLQPCANYSKKLTPAEQNYDIGNRELLAIKLALDEWRHWLEGVNHPFTVITDHTNLQYLREANRVNPQQAHWALFFTWFDFTIAYRPGNHNCKADTLSRLHSPETPADPEPILPPPLIVNPIVWSIDKDIKVQGSLLFVTYTIIQGIISSEMQVMSGVRTTTLTEPAPLHPIISTAIPSGLCS